MVGWSVLANWDANNRSDSDFAQRYADMVFATLPPDAVLLAHHDPVLLPTGVLPFRGGTAARCAAHEFTGILGFPDRSVSPHLRRTPLREKRLEAILEFAAETERPVFHTKWDTRGGIKAIKSGTIRLFA